MNPYEGLNETQQYLADLCDALKFVLIEKNRRYGNSALDPIRVFSKLPEQNSIKIRIDDKLNRIRNNPDPNPKCNDLIDTAGYLILLLASIKADPEQIRNLID